MASPLLDPSHCVSNNLHKTARAVSRVYAEEMRPAGLARSQFAILEHLARGGALAVSELADGLYMERTTLTRNLKPLEHAGFVARKPSDTDARIRLVEITGEGRSRLTLARRHWRNAQARLLKLFGEDEWRALEATLRGLRRLVR